VSDPSERTQAQGPSAVVVDLPTAMAAIADLLAETLDFDGKWSPGLDAARAKGRELLREWSAKR